MNCLNVLDVHSVTRDSRWPLCRSRLDRAVAVWRMGTVSGFRNEESEQVGVGVGKGAWINGR